MDDPSSGWTSVAAVGVVVFVASIPLSGPTARAVEPITFGELICTKVPLALGAEYAGTIDRWCVVAGFKWLLAGGLVETPVEGAVVKCFAREPESPFAAAGTGRIVRALAADLALGRASLPDFQNVASDRRDVVSTRARATSFRPASILGRVLTAVKRGNQCKGNDKGKRDSVHRRIMAFAISSRNRRLAICNSLK